MPERISPKSDASKGAFARYLADLKAADIKQLPSERQLAIHFNVSRWTIRKVLKHALEQGLIRREGRKLINALDCSSLAGCGRILFISVGKNGKFTYSAMDRLFNALREEVTGCGGEITHLLTNNRTSPEILEKKINEFDVILLAVVTCRSRRKMNEIFASAKDKVMIQLGGADILIPPERRNSIMPDNYLIGKGAAKLLLDSHCRKPLALWKRSDNRDFSERAQGFCDTLFQANCGGVQSVFWLDQSHYALEAKKLMIWALDHDYDGFFVMSDENISSFASILYDRERKKWRFPLITVDGSQDSQRFDPPICAMGHGIQYCCSAIIETLHDIAEKKFNGVRKLIKPDYHHASSLALPGNDARWLHNHKKER